ncbi:MAG: hypothetical protein QN212_00510, partial [Armatimonadota bacterium]|nr:hypothetical protein [Armatimonadota bacterium]MDR7515818.1 hypothetical protein [Armatimonadota bacterium]
IEPTMRNDEPDGVGPDGQHAAAADDINEARLLPTALGVRLSEPGGDDTHRPHAGSGALLHHRTDSGPWEDDESEIRGSGEITHPGVGCVPEYSVGSRVDRIEGSGKSSIHEVLEQDTSRLGRIRGSAHDGNGPRRQQGTKVAHP